MQDPKLWLINTVGKVFTLSTQSRHLRHVTSSFGDCSEFKRLSAVGQCTWALGSDHQLYVYIPSSDIPIRVQEATYENERWTPGVGWTGKKLIPGARHNWSDVNGRGVLPRENFVLPSKNWEWEGPWQVDENMGGEVSGLLGWQYAVNWIGNFSAESTWRSYVRRRKWVRYRRFISTDRWVQVAALDDDFDEHTEPFLDLSVGGDQLPSQVDGQLLVWAVSITGRVYIRDGVCFSCPEGHTWRHIPIPSHGDIGVIEVSVGPNGLVWVVTWDGEAFVRTNVSSETPHGTGWVKVPCPENNPLQQVSVGREAVWALSRDGKIWFWKFPPEADLFDGSWVEMVGQMAFITVGNTDQVFAISLQDMAVCMRTGVSPELPTGKTWQQLTIRGPRSEDIQSSLDSHTSAGSSFCSSSRASLKGTSDSQLKNSIQCSNSFASLSVCSTNYDKPQNVENSICDKDSNINHKVVYVPNNCIINQTVDRTSESNRTTQMSVTTPDVSKSAISDDEVHPPDKQTVDISSDFTVQSEQQISNKESSESEKEKLGFPQNRLVSQGSSELGSLTSNHSDCVDFVTDLLAPEEKDEIYSQPVDETCNFVTDLISEHTRIDIGDKVTSPSTVPSIAIDDALSNAVDDYPSIVKVCSIDPNINSEEADTGDNMTNRTELISKDKENCATEDPPVTKDGSVEFLESEKLKVTGSLRTYRHSPGGGDIRDSPSVGRFSGTEDVDLDWIWISATACNIEDSSQLPWLLAITEDEMKDKAAIDPSTRQIILEQIKSRNAVSRKFSHCEDAIEKTVWVKRGQLQLRTSHRRGKAWVSCDLELEQGVQRDSAMDGLLYLSYTYNKKQMHVKISLLDIVCISRMADDSKKAAFAIFLPEDVEAKNNPYVLSAQSEKETDDWVASVAMASNVMKHRGHSIDSATFWAVTELGDVFVHQHPGKIQRLSQTHWEQIGGQMLMVQTNSRGVTWAISHDHTAYIYTGGYGGGIFKGVGDASRDIYPQTDVRKLCVYENQKWHLVTGFSHRHLLANKYAWTDETGKVPLTMDTIQPPSNSWQWVDDWKVDFTAPGGVDVDGWQYTISFPSRESGYHGENNWRDSYRRRKWVRQCRMTTSGPWLPVGPLSLIDVSVGPPDPVANVTEVWAVGENGDALFRSGVTIDRPQGEGWCHVAADQSFCAISVGGNHWLWAVARGGSVWFRSGITLDNPTGKVWLQVVPPPPGGYPLQQISVGDNSVWGVDSNKCLWRRKDTTVIFPEGTEWELVSKDIRQVSVGPGDQVFAVRDYVASKKSHVNGVISRRWGITEDKPSGTNWVDGIGGIWSGVCCGGFIMAGE